MFPLKNAKKRENEKNTLKKSKVIKKMVYNCDLSFRITFMCLEHILKRSGPSDARWLQKSLKSHEISVKNGKKRPKSRSNWKIITQKLLIVSTSYLFILEDLEISDFTKWNAALVLCGNLL